MGNIYGLSIPGWRSWAMGPQPWSEGFRDLSSRGRDTTLVQIDRNPHLRIFEWPYKPSQSTLELVSKWTGFFAICECAALLKIPFLFLKRKTSLIKKRCLSKWEVYLVNCELSSWSFFLTKFLSNYPLKLSASSNHHKYFGQCLSGIPHDACRSSFQYPTTVDEIESLK